MAKTLKLPAIVTCEDYHIFDDYIKVLKQLGVTGVKYREIACDWEYFAVFYIGKKPEKKIVKKLLINAFPEMEEVDEFIRHGY